MLHKVFDFFLNVVFNACMTDTSDKKLIESLGGPAKVAELLKFGKGGTQRVHNWMARGIPARVKLDHPEVFLVSVVLR